MLSSAFLLFALLVFDLGNESLMELFILLFPDRPVVSGLHILLIIFGPAIMSIATSSSLIEFLYYMGFVQLSPDALKLCLFYLPLHTL
jgi:hypothetical protein